MTVYNHKQEYKSKKGKPSYTYKAYRVARSVNGKLIQDYFPFTKKGQKEAEAYDNKLKEDQARFQKEWNAGTPGGKGRWAKT